ncbi:diphosphoinositol polyphosphate phosphohydrolase 3-beta [Silurus asotus]|uniref:diphosphoinositol-polyphosphate diphosphatase n=1 Tax=Silurus asotus TaxID=30991 RepID=A0AAD5FFF5_SILAS|nr:diphosphoinositol polyphosphate phosphohydrolase 3-beta [Silurus asotus]
MKFKPNQTRTYDGEGFKQRAACLCFRNEREDEKSNIPLFLLLFALGYGISSDVPNEARPHNLSDQLPSAFTTRVAIATISNRYVNRADWLPLLHVLLVSSSRHPDQWIVPGGGMEPEEEPCGAAVREVYEEAGVKGTLGRLLGVFEHNQDRKHRTYVYVLTVTETLEAWEDSINIGRKREWFPVEEAIKILQSHKPVHAEYLRRLQLSCSATDNGNILLPPPPPNDNAARAAACR